MITPDPKKIAEKIIEASSKDGVVDVEAIKEHIRRALLAYHASMVVGENFL